MATINADIRKMTRNLLTNANLIRKENSLSVPEFARAAGVSASTVYRMERARKNKSNGRVYNPTISTVVKIANTVGFSPEQIMAEKLG